MNDIDEEDEDFKQIVDTYVVSYIKGLEIMRMLRMSYAAIYEDVYSLEQAYQKTGFVKNRYEHK